MFLYLFETFILLCSFVESHLSIFICSTCSLYLLLRSLGHIDFGSEDDVPELAAHAEADGSEFVVMLHVVKFHVTEEA